jgi:hypothetical protein
MDSSRRSLERPGRHRVPLGRSSPAAAAAAITVLALFLFAPSGRLEAQARAVIRADWAFLQRTADGGMKAIDCTGESAQLRSGDRIRVWLKPSSGCFLYLYLYDAQKDLYALFPQSPRFWDGPRAAGASYLVPGPDSWFRLDNGGGVEIFYLIFSDHRLRVLEQSTGTAGREASAGGTFRKLDRPVEALEEIRRLVVESSSLAGASEKPVPVAGDFRNLEEDPEIDGVCTEVSGLYVRTIRLAH